MHTHRFGRKLKLPSTVAIKHGILKLMLQDHLKSQGIDTAATGCASMLRDGVNASTNPRRPPLNLSN